MRRREFITLLGGAAAAWPAAARGQQASMPVIGFLHAGFARAFSKQVKAFRQGLKAGGYVEGQNVAIEFRWAEGQSDRLPILAADLVRRQVAVIAAIGGSTPALAAKVATATIPIVFNTGADPIGSGLVTSLNRPGGNITGVSFFLEELGAKGLGLLHELVPNAGTVGLIVNPSNQGSPRQIANMRGATRGLGLQLEVANVSNVNDLDKAYEVLVGRRVGALVLGADPFIFVTRKEQFIALSARHRIPTNYYRREFVEAGGLMSYGTDTDEAYSQIGTYVAQILKGAKPGDLPVMQTTKFEFVINLKTAKTLGLEIPPTLLARADDVIE